MWNLPAMSQPHYHPMAKTSRYLLHIKGFSLNEILYIVIRRGKRGYKVKYKIGMYLIVAFPLNQINHERLATIIVIHLCMRAKKDKDYTINYEKEYRLPKS